MNRRFLGVILLMILVGAQATAVASPLLRHDHERCTCHQRICVCHFGKRAAKPAKPAEPSCHEPAGEAAPAANPAAQVLQNCDGQDEKDVASVPVYVLPQPAVMNTPMPGAATPVAGAILAASPVFEISPPPPRSLSV